MQHLECEDLNLPKQRLFKARTYVSVAVIKEDYLAAKSLCSIDGQLVETFANAFIKKHEKEALSGSAGALSSGWEILALALREATTRQYRPALKALKVILSLKGDKQQPSLTVRHIRSLHNLLVETDIHTYAAMVGDAGDPEGLVGILIDGVLLNSRLVAASNSSRLARPHQDLLLLKPGVIGQVEIAHPDVEKGCFESQN